MHTVGQKFVTTWGYMADPLVFVVNKDIWTSWTPADQAIVRQAAVDAGKLEIAQARKGLIEADKPVLKDIAAMGVTVTQLTAAEREAFVKITRPVYTKWKATVGVEQVPLVSNPDELASTNLFDRLIKLRDLQRARLAQSTFLIRGAELPWELNSHGRMQWYLHPCIAYTAVQTNLFYRQEIPVGSRSGVQRHGGDAIFYMLEGEGYTELDGARHIWKAGDVLTLPIFPNGVVYRHVNTGEVPVRLICMERNMVHTTGVDRQSGFEQLQPCPEYRAMQAD